MTIMTNFMDEFTVFKYSSLMAIGVGVACVIAGAIIDTKKARERYNLEQAVYREADTNKNSQIDSNEWLDIYKKVGVMYDGKQRPKLTNAQLEQYLQPLESISGVNNSMARP